ncbi:MAG: hypothetical protein WDN69_37290 [Aliidongia sp.]
MTEIFLSAVLGAISHVDLALSAVFPRPFWAVAEPAPAPAAAQDRRVIVDDPGARRGRGHLALP